MLGKLYEFLWYHSQFWIKDKSKRCPYTFLMRDFYHENPLLTILGISSIFYAAGRWWIPVSLKTFVLGIICLFVGTVLGHLFWGKQYIPEEQEFPKYNPENG